MRFLLLGALSFVAFAAPAALATPFAPANSAVVEDAGWVADYDQGLALAVEQKKDLFVEFTGSDWCPPCKQLYAEVFSKPEFAEAMKDRFVLVKLDFPRSEEVKAKVPNVERNAEIRDQFTIRGYPTVLLMTTDGTVYARSVGYGRQGLEGYIDFVREQHTTGKAAIADVKALVKRYEAAEGDARVPLVGEAHAMIEKLGDSPLSERLVPIVRAGMELDPKDERGHLSSGLALLLKKDLATAEDAAKAKELDADNSRGLREKVVMWSMNQVRDDEGALAALEDLDVVLASGIKDDEIARGTLFTAINWCSNQLEDMERARRYGKQLSERFPEDEEVKSFLERVLTEQ